MSSKREEFWSFISAIAVLIAMVAMIGTTAPPANAEPKKLKLSPTGEVGTYADNLPEPLFTGTYAAGAATADFWVQNNSNQLARATLTLVEKPDPNELEDDLSFSATVDGVSSAQSVALEGSGECRTIVTGPTLEVGDDQRFDVTMHMADTAPMGFSEANFEFVLTLSQVTKKGKVNVCGQQPPGHITSQPIQVMGAQTTAPQAQRSPGTPMSAERGATTVLGWSALGVLLAGLLLAARQRRRSTE